MIRIFISSRMNGEVDRWRQFAMNAIEETARTFKLDIAPVVFEHKECPPSTTARIASLQWVKESNAFIGIYYKTVSSIIIEEFRTANERAIPVFVFIKTLKESELPCHELQQYRNLKTFILNEVKPEIQDSDSSGYVYKHFNDQDIKEHIQRSILEYYPKRFDFKRIPDKYTLSQADTERLQSAQSLFVAPECFKHAIEILLGKKIIIITGPAHTGKTTFGFFLAYYLYEQKKVRRIIRYPTDGALSGIRDLKNCAIMFDDPFGSVKFSPYLSYLGDQFSDLLHQLCSHNFLIMTTRKHILQAALSDTKLGEFAELDDLKVEVDPNHYTREKRRQILENHLTYYNTSEKECVYARQHADEIVSSLSFPHSYKIFVCKGLTEAVSMTKRLSESLREANEIEKVVGRWFSSFYNTDKETFYFLFILALFPDLEPHDFSEVHSILIDQIRKVRFEAIAVPRYDDLKRLSLDTLPYVFLSRTINYSHPSYREGILQRIADQFSGDVVLILPSLESFASERHRTIRTSVIHLFQEIGPLMPDEIIPVLKRLVESDWRRDRGALDVLCELGTAFPEKVLPVIEELLSHENWGVREDTRKMLSRLGSLVPDKILSVVLRWADDTSSPNRFDAILSLEKILPLRFETIMPLLHRWSKDVDSDVRKAVALCVRDSAKKRPEDILPLLRDLLNDKEWIVRRAADLALSRYFGSSY